MLGDFFKTSHYASFNVSSVMSMEIIGGTDVEKQEQLSFLTCQR